MDTPMHKIQKASSATGRNAPKKKDGYASGRVHESMIGTKPGVLRGSRTNPVAYSGPNVVRAPRGA